ncbi:MAG: MBL fold metallo-hydrolase [Thermodesulfobacteriota bacterium]
MVAVYVLLVIVALVLLFFARTLIRLKTGNARVAKELAQTRYTPLEDIGTVDSVSILPLVDFYTDNPRLKTEAGVAYLVKAGNTTLLMDVGFNKKKAHPSPLLHNMRTLDIKPESIDAVVISHVHLDHVGGMTEQRTKTFSLSQGPVDLGNIPVYAPQPVKPSRQNPKPGVTVAGKPQKLAQGVATTGAIPRNLYLMGYTLEQSLAVRVKGKGIVIIIGCGHPTVERIVERVKMLFNEPVYAIIGGLHFPVHGGRIMAGPVNVQSLVGTDRPPWQPIGEADVDNTVAAIKTVNPALVALSPHDSSDWSLDRFRAAFGSRYVDLKVGTPIHI